MSPAMSHPPLPRRTLVVHAGPEAFAPMTRVILARLGYAMIAPEEYEAQLDSGEIERADLRLVDERRLAEVPDEPSGAVPIVMLCGRHGVTGADPRIAGAVKKPAGLHEIYRLAQQILEERPRSTPRVPVHLPARCVRGGREWLAVLLSLSENGCLLRTPEPLLLGSQVQLRFDLPRHGMVCVDAETSYQLVPDFGIVFSGTAAADRAAIGRYVREALVAA
jgi:hypothetical protein